MDSLTHLFGGVQATATATVPANGAPENLEDFVRHEALAYRAQGTREADFLADQLDRIAQLIVWTHARTPDDYTSRLEVWEDSIREKEYERGYVEGLANGRRGR